MEVFSKTTRFALACNTSDKVIEPIQSRCAVVRFMKLTNEEVAARIMDVCRQENVEFTEDGLEAVVYTAQGDLRQALNNLQSANDGFGKVTSETVFKVCDEPHPLLIKKMLDHCIKDEYTDAYDILKSLWKLGYSAEDIVVNIFRTTKTLDKISEGLRLDFIKEIGTTHLRAAQGVQSLLQLSALLARLCIKAVTDKRIVLDGSGYITL